MTNITITSAANSLIGNPTGSDAAVTSITLGSGLEFDGTAIKLIGGDMISPLINTPVSITGTANLTSTAMGKLHICSGTSANYTITLPTSGIAANSMIGFQMAPLANLSKLVTLDAGSGKTIDGSQTRIMWADEIAVLKWDGSNWQKLAGKTKPMICCMQISSSASIPNTMTQTKLNLANTVINNTGLMADPTTNYRINIVRSGYYIGSSVVGWSNLTSNATRIMGSIYKNGSAVATGEIYGPSGGYPIIYAVSNNMYWSVNDYLELNSAQNSGGGQTVATAIATITEIPQW